MRKPTLPLVLAATLWLCARPAPAPADEARDLVKRALAALPQVPFVATLKLSVDAGPPRELQLSYKVVGGVRASFLEVRSPLDLQGTRFLFLERPEARSDQYLSVPVSRKVIEVADTVRKYSFLGSTFYVADLIAPQLDAFTYTLDGEDDVAGRHCRLVEAVPTQPERAIYSKTLVGIDMKDGLILKRLFLDEQGALLKAWTVDRVEKVDGHWVLMDQRMRNLQDHNESRLEITQINYHVELPDSMFTPQHLAR
ncbi:MAG TPA: outer membrane lipoprotein-sorting protein [Candidatus Kryptonia bacterium]|nr:outer membrane lipoprotein-sorting protein [Candidatus Kryptonia bacterium]